jgi:hypothetical protein
LWLLAAGVVLLTTFVVAESRIAEPMFALWLFRIRAFTAGNIAIHDFLLEKILPRQADVIPVAELEGLFM